MNNQRRKELEAVIDELQDTAEKLNQLKDEEDEYLENMPENLQYSQKHDDASDAVDAMNTALDYLHDCISSIEEVL